MDLSRRELLRYASLTAAGLALAGCRSCDVLIDHIRNRPTRRDITLLGTAHPVVQAFREAVTKMKALPAGDRRNWTRQAQIHNDFCPHGNWLFLSWHRAYLFYFEQICRELSTMKEFALPYWNWSKDRAIPGEFWGPGNALLDTTRFATPTSQAPAAAVAGTVVDDILDESNFQVFGSGSIPLAASQRQGSTYGRLEGTPHNSIHGFVGGNMGNFMSPLDPLFWCHHNMIEHCWVEWNLGRGHPNPNDAAWLDREFTEFCDGAGSPVTISTRTMLLFPILAYQYDELDLALPAKAQALQRRRPVEDRDSRAFLERGAPARLESSTLASVRLRAQIRRNAPARLALELPSQPMRQLLDPATSLRALLLVEVDQGRDTGDFHARVFLDLPEAGADTPLDDPHYVGSFALFVHKSGAEHDHGALRFTLDATEALRRLGARAGRIELSVVLVPYPGRDRTEPELTIAALELGTQSVKE